MQAVEEPRKGRADGMQGSNGLGGSSTDDLEDLEREAAEDLEEIRRLMQQRRQCREMETQKAMEGIKREEERSKNIREAMRGAMEAMQSAMKGVERAYKEDALTEPRDSQITLLKEQLHVADKQREIAHGAAQKYADLYHQTKRELDELKAGTRSTTGTSVNVQVDAGVGATYTDKLGPGFEEFVRQKKREKELKGEYPLLVCLSPSEVTHTQVPLLLKMAATTPAVKAHTQQHGQSNSYPIVGNYQADIWPSILSDLTTSWELAAMYLTSLPDEPPATDEVEEAAVPPPKPAMPQELPVEAEEATSTGKKRRRPDNDTHDAEGEAEANGATQRKTGPTQDVQPKRRVTKAGDDHVATQDVQPKRRVTKAGDDHVATQDVQQQRRVTKAGEDPIVEVLANRLRHGRGSTEAPTKASAPKHTPSKGSAQVKPAVDKQTPSGRGGGGGKVIPVLPASIGSPPLWLIQFHLWMSRPSPKKANVSLAMRKLRIADEADIDRALRAPPITTNHRPRNGLVELHTAAVQYVQVASEFLLQIGGRQPFPQDADAARQLLQSSEKAFVNACHKFSPTQRTTYSTWALRYLWEFLVSENVPGIEVESSETEEDEEEEEEEENTGKRRRKRAGDEEEEGALPAISFPFDKANVPHEFKEALYEKFLAMGLTDLTAKTYQNQVVGFIRRVGDRLNLKKGRYTARELAGLLSDNWSKIADVATKASPINQFREMLVGGKTTKRSSTSKPPPPSAKQEKPAEKRRGRPPRAKSDMAVEELPPDDTVQDEEEEAKGEDSDLGEDSDVADSDDSDDEDAGPLTSSTAPDYNVTHTEAADADDAHIQFDDDEAALVPEPSGSVLSPVSAIVGEPSAIAGETSATGPEVPPATSAISEPSATGMPPASAISHPSAMVGEPSAMVGEPSAMVGEPSASAIVGEPSAMEEEDDDDTPPLTLGTDHEPPDDHGENFHELMDLARQDSNMSEGGGFDMDEHEENGSMYMRTPEGAWP